MKKTLCALLFLGAISFSNSVNAQPPDPGGGEDGSLGCFPPPCVPIDGGTSLLLIAGLAYGSKKAYDLKKINN